MGRKQSKPKKELKPRRCSFISQTITEADIGSNQLTFDNGTTIEVNTITATDVGKVVHFNLGRFE